MKSRKGIERINRRIYTEDYLNYLIDCADKVAQSRTKFLEQKGKSMYNQIKEQQLAARKAKESVKASLLTTLLGEIQTSVTGGLSASQSGLTKDINPSDDEVFKIVKKFIKNTETSLSLIETEKAKEELDILRSLLPSQLSLKEIEEEVISFIKRLQEENKFNPKSVTGLVMKHMNNIYPNRFESKDVMNVIKQSS